MSKERILIVEDEMIIALSIQKTLERLGYSVPGIAITGEDAISMAKDLSPDLILMDIILSGEMDGIAAARRIRMRSDQPIIYLTANADGATVERARDTQPYGYLNKPVNERDLMSNIDTALHKHRMEMRLRESEEKYRSLIESLRDIVMSSDEHGIVTYISPQVKEITGYDESDVVGRNFNAFIHPDDLQVAAEMFEGAMRGETREGVYRVYAKSGGEIWLRVSGKPVFVDGRFNGVRGIVSDITARIRTEEEVRHKNDELTAANEELQATVEELEATNDEFESQNRQLLRAQEELAQHEARLAGILRVAPVGLGIVTPQDRFGWTNKRFQEMTGYAGALLEGQSPGILFGGLNEPQRMQEGLRSQMTQGGTGSVEARLVRRDGTAFDVLVRATFMDGKGPGSGIVLALLDITELKMAAGALAESEKKYRLLANNITDYLWVVDIHTMQFTYASPSVRELLGYNEGEVLRLTINDVLSAASLETARSILMRERVRDREPGTDPDRSVTIDLEQVRKDGSIVWTEVKTKFLRNEKGRITSILGVSRDITARKRTEQSLAESEKKYRLLAENVSDSIWVLDLATMKFTYNSPSSVNVLGYDEKESRELTPEKIVTKNSLDQVMHILAEELARDGQPGVDPDRTINLELEQIHKEGYIVWTEVNTRPLRNETGAVIGILGVSRNITERRRAEERTRLQRDLALALSAAPNLDEALRIGLEAAVRGSGLDCGGLYLKNRETGDMYLARHQGLGEEFALHVFQYAADSPNVQFYRAGGAAYGHYRDLEMNSDPSRSAEGLRAIAMIPIIHDGEAIAGMNISSHTVDDVSPAARDFLETIATHIGNVIVRMEIQESLVRSEEKFRLMIENSPFPIAVVDDATGAISYANRSFEETLGYSAVTVPTMDAWWNAGFPDQKYRKTVKGRLVQGVRAARAGNRTGQTTEADVRCADGTFKHIEIHMVYLRDLWYFIMNDLTQKKINEEMMIQSEKMLSLGGLAAGMAHEINNPLGIILQGIQGVLNRLSPDVRKNREVAAKAGADLDVIRDYLVQREIIDYLNGVQEAGMRAAKIVENMLQFSRRGETVIAPVDINALIDKTVEIASYDYDLKKMYDFKKIAISRNFGGMPAVPCSETGIEQVVLNLLKNSAYALASVRDKDFKPQITIQTRAKNGYALIEVSDNGPGIPAEIKGHIFEPFFTTKGTGAGTGLGLSVSNYIVVTNHNGSLAVKSVPGHGATFTIRLPLTREDNG